ncbi:MAG: histidine kinase [Chloroflexi bacterium]|nr:histidine kinase [Chloroflexota bacterium]
MSNNPQSVIAQIQKEHDTIARRIRENVTLMEQSTLEVERLQQRNVQVSSQLKRVDENFETLPRQDIKVAYEDAIDAKTRLLTMRCQLEKLQDNQAQLEHLQDLLSRLLDVLGSMHLPSAGGEKKQGPQLGLAGETIIRIVQAQEQERQQLANSLHDGPAQSLTNFILQAEVCQRLMSRDPDRANEELDNLKGAASNTFQKIRDFIFDLRPMMLDDLGLIPTLRRYTENFQNKTSVEVSMNVAGEEKRRLPKHTEVMVFRSIQNLLAISAQKLKASSIRLTLDVDIDTVRAVLEDDGIGFDPLVDLDPEQGDSDIQVLNDVRERIELVEGTLQIFSEEGTGSRFEINLPIFEDIPRL